MDTSEHTSAKTVGLLRTPLHNAAIHKWMAREETEPRCRPGGAGAHETRCGSIAVPVATAQSFEKGSSGPSDEAGAVGRGIARVSMFMSMSMPIRMSMSKCLTQGSFRERERERETTTNNNTQQHNAEEENMKGGEINEREETDIPTNPKCMSVELISEIQIQTGPVGIKFDYFCSTGVCDFPSGTFHTFCTQTEVTIGVETLKS